MRERLGACGVEGGASGPRLNELPCSSLVLMNVTWKCCTKTAADCNRHLTDKQFVRSTTLSDVAFATTPTRTPILTPPPLRSSPSFNGEGGVSFEKSGLERNERASDVRGRRRQILANKEGKFWRAGKIATFCSTRHRILKGGGPEDLVCGPDLKKRSQTKVE